MGTPETTQSARAELTPWWKRTTVYQVYPRSFADSNGDGIGDLRGLLGKLDYLRDLGVETLWLSPFFESPQADFGYDISDHYGIAPEYGTLEECDALIREVHARGMKIVFDMVLNHTSDKHPWFLESQRAALGEKRDFYLWRKGRGRSGKAPPNNWRSMLGGSGWHRDAASGEWYFASFLPCQPDLNYRNPKVKAAMLDVVRHWLGRGVDGLRLDIFNAIFKDASYADNPFSFRPVPTEDNPHGFFQRHLHTVDHPDTLAFAKELRTVVDEHQDPPRFLVGEVFGDAETLRGYCGEAADGLNLVFLFQTLRTRLTGPGVRGLVTDLERWFPEPFSPTYVFGNHDRPRFIHRVGGDADRAKLIAALQLTARGVPFVYYGEEIGMENHDIPLHEGLDPVAARFSFVPRWLVPIMRRRGILLNRDECRAPMQWDASPNAGFSKEGATPWLPVHPGSKSTNVAAQEADPSSLLHWYRRLFAMRRLHGALQEGALTWLDLPDAHDDVVAYRRASGDERVDVLLNFGRRPHCVTLPEGDCTLVSSRGGDASLAPTVYTLRPYEAVILTCARTASKLQLHGHVPHQDS